MSTPSTSGIEIYPKVADQLLTGQGLAYWWLRALISLAVLVALGLLVFLVVAAVHGDGLAATWLSTWGTWLKGIIGYPVVAALGLAIEKPDWMKGTPKTLLPGAKTS